MNRYQYQNPQVIIDAERREFEREWTSNREHLYTFRAVLVLLLCACISGLAVTITMLAWFMDAWTGLAWAFKIGTSVATILWFYLLRIWKGWIEPFERISGVDWNRDGRIGGQPEEPEQFEVRVIKERHDGAYTGDQYMMIDQSKDKWQRFCRAVCEGVPMTYDNFTPADSGWYSRQEFGKLRSQMATLDWIVERTNQAPEPTPLGWGIFQHFAKLPIDEWCFPAPLDEPAMLESGT